MCAIPELTEGTLYMLSIRQKVAVTIKKDGKSSENLLFCPLMLDYLFNLSTSKFPSNSS